MTIKQVVNKSLGKYELTNEVRGQAFAKDEDNVYLVIRTKEYIKKGKRYSYYNLIPLLNTRNSNNAIREYSKTQLLREFDVFVSCSKEECKTLITDLLAA